MIDEQIFRAYDIRGIVDEHLTEEAALLIGKALGKYYLADGISKVSVGYDCRLHSERLFNNLAAGLTSTGVSVIKLGMIATPILYFSQFHLGLDGGVMITGSHNPKDYNGFKICHRKMTIAGEEIQTLRKIIESGDFPSGEGKIEEYDIADAYISRIVEDIKLGPNLGKVVVDSANGTAGPWIKAALDRLGVDGEFLYNEPDGNFPNHHPDPSVPENLEVLANKIRELNADLGFAFDGDSDRIGLLDENGSILWGDMLLLILGRQLAKDIPGATVIGEVKCSQVMYDELEKTGLKTVMSKVGHSFIKRRLIDEKAALAGEVSGHFFYKHRYYGYDDAIYTALRTLEIASSTKAPVSSLVGLESLPVNTPEIRYPAAEDRKISIVESCKKYYSEKGLDLSEIDGIRITFEEGWGLIRPSNTTPHLILRFEAKDEATLNQYKDEAINLLEGLK